MKISWALFWWCFYHKAIISKIPTASLSACCSWRSCPGYCPQCPPPPCRCCPQISISFICCLLRPWGFSPPGELCGCPLQSEARNRGNWWQGGYFKGTGPSVLGRFMICGSWIRCIGWPGSSFWAGRVNYPQFPTKTRRYWWHIAPSILTVSPSASGMNTS